MIGTNTLKCLLLYEHIDPDNKVDGANMGPTWVVSAPCRPHVGPMNLAIRGVNDVSQGSRRLSLASGGGDTQSSHMPSGAGGLIIGQVKGILAVVKRLNKSGITLTREDQLELKSVSCHDITRQKVVVDTMLCYYRSRESSGCSEIPIGVTPRG